MAKQFLDASGLNQYTQALKNKSLVVGLAVDASNATYAVDASNAKYAETADATGLIGIVPLANLPQGALDRLVQVADKAARLRLSTADVQLGDTVQELDTKLMYIVVDESKLGSEAAFVEYTAGRASFAKDASHADKADLATSAIHADGATDASHADKADLATNATHADGATDASNAKYAVDASNAKYAATTPWDGIINTPTAFPPTEHEGSLVTQIGYLPASAEGDVQSGDNLGTALIKLQTIAKSGADEPIDDSTIAEVIAGTYRP